MSTISTVNKKMRWLLFEVVVVDEATWAKLNKSKEVTMWVLHKMKVTHYSPNNF